MRRQALQEEIDRESGKTKVFSPQVQQVRMNLDVREILCPRAPSCRNHCGVLYVARERGHSHTVMLENGVVGSQGCPGAEQ